MSEEKYKICPICGGRMWQSVSGNWLCGNCEAIEMVGGKVYKDRALIPRMKELGANPSVKFIPTFDWQAFRAEAAKDFVAAILAGGANQTDNEGNVFRTIEDIAKGSIAFADALIKQLKEDGTE